MITNLILSLGLSFAVGLNGIKENHNNYLEDNQTNVVYNDTSRKITLSYNEISNYSFENFYNSLLNQVNNVGLNYDISSLPNGSELSTFFEYGEAVDEEYINYTNEDNNAINIYLNYGTYNFTFEAVINETTYNEFIQNENLEISCNTTSYTIIKNAIELDIQANQVEPASKGNSIISAIVSGLGLISDLAREFLTGFSTLFWNANNSTLTSFGTFALVMLGVAITMAVISLVLNLIRGNTGA